MAAPRILKPLVDFAARPMVRNVTKVLAGNIAGNALNLVGGVLVGTVLGPALFGLYGVLQGAMLLLAQLSDFGLNTTIVKTYRDLDTRGRPEAAEAMLRWTLWLRMMIVVTIAAVAIGLAGPITERLLDAPDAVGLFRLACLGACGSSLWMYCQAAMQSRQQFGWYAGLTTANHALRLALLVVLWQAERLDLPAAVIVLATIPFIGSLGAGLLWPRGFWRARMAADERRAEVREVFGLSRWIFLSALVAALILQTDRFLMLPLAGEAATGIFQMAHTLAMGFPLITAAVSTVFLPRLAATRRRDEMLRFVGIFLKAVPLLAVFVAAVIGLAHLLLPLVREGEFRPSLPVFDLLAVSFSLSIIVNPLSFFCLAFNRAHWLTAMNVAQLGLTVGLDLLLIPSMGALAAGVSALVVRLFALVYLGLAFRRLLALAETATDELRV